MKGTCVDSKQNLMLGHSTTGEQWGIGIKNSPFANIVN